MSDLPIIPPRPTEDSQPGLHQHLEGFQISDELEAVAQRLVERHGRLRFLDDYGLAYLLHHTDPPKAKAGPHTWASARLVPKWARALTRVDGAVTVNAPVWTVLTETQREALMLHELLHFGQNEDTGALEIVPHEIEEFGFVVATYGAWRGSVAAFAEQLALGLPRGGAAPDGL